MPVKISNFLKLIWYLLNKAVRGGAIGGAFFPGPGTVIGAFIAMIPGLAKKLSSFYEKKK